MGCTVIFVRGGGNLCNKENMRRKLGKERGEPPPNVLTKIDENSSNSQKFGRVQKENRIRIRKERVDQDYSG